MKVLKHIMLILVKIYLGQALSWKDSSYKHLQVFLFNHGKIFYLRWSISTCKILQVFLLILGKYWSCKSIQVLLSLSIVSKIEQVILKDLIIEIHLIHKNSRPTWTKYSYNHQNDKIFQEAQVFPDNPVLRANLGFLFSFSIFIIDFCLLWEKLFLRT